MPTIEETETTITWTSADEFATVYTMHPRIKRACEHAGGREIRADEGIRAGRKIAWTFLVPAAMVKIRRPRSLTDAQKERLILRGKQLSARKRKETEPATAA